jgi:hypothetical protein
MGLLAVHTARSAASAEDKPATATAEQVQRLIDQLGSRDFSARQSATAELEKLGESVLPALREVLKSQLDLETKTRVEKLIGRIELALEQADEKKWDSKEKVAMRRRLWRLVDPYELAGQPIEPQLTDGQLAQALYLLVAGRSPKQQETTHVEKQLRQAVKRRPALLALGLELVKGDSFNADVAAANLQMLEYHEKLIGANLVDALRSINSPDVSNLTQGIAQKLLKAKGLTDAELNATLYLLALSRFPREEETKAAVAHLQKPGDRQKATEDICWALLNSKEFIFYKRR